MSNAEFINSWINRLEDAKRDNESGVEGAQEEVNEAIFMLEKISWY